MRNIHRYIKKKGKLLRVPQSEIILKKESRKNPALLEVQMPHKQTEQVAFTELFWPLCFDCLCCMHKIFMLWKICSNKKRRGFLLEPPQPPLNFSPCACNFSHSNEITSKKKRRGKLCYLNVALSLAAPIFLFIAFCTLSTILPWLSERSIAGFSQRESEGDRCKLFINNDFPLTID